VLAIFAAFALSFDAPFVLDDIPNIAENETIRDLTAWRRVLSPPAESGVGGRPVLNATFALNYAIGGLNVRGYHVLNTAIHALAALTLLSLIRRTLASPLLHGRWSAPALFVATIISLLWALHPFQTASVTYVSQRAESLMGLFYLLVLYCVARGAAPGASRAWPAAAVVACLVGVGTKEVIVTAPVIVLLYDRTFLAGSFRAAWHQRRLLYVALAAACIPLVFLMSDIANRGIGAGDGVTPLSYALTEFRVVVDYLKLAAWPHPLVFDYGPIAPAPLASLACALLLAIIFIGVIFALIRQPALGFVGAWFFVLLAPTSTIVPVTFQPMAENRVYLPLAALATAAVIGVYARWPRRSALLLAVLTTACFALTVQRNVTYCEPTRLWTETIAKRPDNDRALNEHALSLSHSGRTTEAIAAFERALARRPEASTLHRNLAVLLLRLDRAQDSLPHFAALVRLRPDFAQGHKEYAHALATVGRLPDAIAQVKAGSALLPGAPGPHVELASLLLRSERPDEALAELATAVRLGPDDAEARNALAQTLFRLGRIPDALPHFEALLRLSPGDSLAYYNYGLALTQVGRSADALVPFQTAVHLKPDSAAAHFGLANTLAALGRLPAAIAEYEHTLQLDPNLPQAREFYTLARSHLAP
jgi:tetratricopeptide (TPR) repeat protein